MADNSPDLTDSVGANQANSYRMRKKASLFNREELAIKDATAQIEAAKARNALDPKNASIWSTVKNGGKGTSAMAASSGAFDFQMVTPEAKVQTEPIFNLRYLVDTPPYFMMLYFYDYVRAAAFENARVEPIGTITLPLPANLAENISTQINDMSFGAFAGELYGYIDKAINAPTLSQGLKEQGSAMIKNFANSQDLRRLAFRRIVGLTPEIKGAIDTMTGSTPNPHLGLVFNGVNLRSYSFSWRVSPNNATESEGLQRIINTIKRQALPRKTKDNFYLKYPSLVKVALGGEMKRLQEYILFKHCMIDNFTVDYAPNGSHSFFRETKLPTDYSFTLSLKETSIHLRDDYYFNGQVISTAESGEGSAGE